MMEFKGTLHGYKEVTPKRCKLARLEPITEEITIPLHYAESAPVAMRVNGPLEYTGKDGNTYTWRSESIELLALDGMLWKHDGWRDREWNIEELARIVDEYDALTRWPYQHLSDDDNPPTNLLARDRGKWGLIENQRDALLKNVDRYAVIGNSLYYPAQELVYAYANETGRGWGKRAEDRAGSVIVAKEYNPRDHFSHYLCNALQDWRVVNIYDKYADRIQDKLMSEVSGVDFIEVLMPEYVKADPYGDYWRKCIKASESNAKRCNEEAKEHDKKAREHKESAKTKRDEARSELAKSREYAEKLENYLASK